MDAQTVRVRIGVNRISRSGSHSMLLMLYPDAHSGILQTPRASIPNFAHVTSERHHREAPATKSTAVLFNVPHNRRKPSVAKISRMVTAAHTTAHHLFLIVESMRGPGSKEEAKATTKKRRCKRVKIERELRNKERDQSDKGKSRNKKTGYRMKL